MKPNFPFHPSPPPLLWLTIATTHTNEADCVKNFLQLPFLIINKFYIDNYKVNILDLCT